MDGSVVREGAGSKKKSRVGHVGVVMEWGRRKGHDHRRVVTFTMLHDGRGMGRGMGPRQLKG